MKKLSPHQTAFILLLIGAVVRLYGLASQSLTMDECSEIELANKSIQEIVNASNSFPPLYHLLLKAWSAIDLGPITVRAFSWLVGMASLIAFWKLAREAATERAGLFALGIAALSPFHVYYSQEGRGYGLFLLFAILAMLYGLRIIRDQVVFIRQDQVGFVVIGVLGTYTHYCFPVVLIAVVIGAMIANGVNKSLRRFVPLAMVIGVLVSPLFLLASHDLEHQRDLPEPRPASLAAMGYTFFSFESGYTLGPSRSELHEMTTSEAAASAIGIFVPVATISVCLLMLGYLCFRERRELVYWLALLIIPILVVAVLCLILGVTYDSRFVVFCWVPYCLLLASGVNALLPKPRLVFCTLLFVLYATALFNRHHVARYQNEDMRSVAELIDSSEPLPTYVCAGYMDGPVRTYMSNAKQVIPLNDSSFAEGSDGDALRTLKEGHASFWFVYSRPLHGDPNGAILNWIKKHSDAELFSQAAGVSVYRCERRVNETVSYDEPVEPTP